jgi:hypothetical protein
MPLPGPAVVATVSEFGTTWWTGQEYSPATATASLSVTAPCANTAWAIHLSITPFTDGVIEIAVPLRVVGGAALDGEGSVAVGGTVRPGVAHPVATGSGTATMQVELELTLPPTVPVGTYVTTMDFTILSGP